MGKVCVSIGIVLACCGFCGGAQAQAPSAVTVSFSEAVIRTAEAQKQMAALKAKYVPRPAKLKALNDRIRELQKQLQATGTALSDSERASRKQTLATEQKQLQRHAEDYKSDTQADSQDVSQTVAQKMYGFLQEYAQEHNYPMVVERGSDAQPVVWYAAANLDITADLVKAYDAQSGVAAPAGLNRAFRVLRSRRRPRPNRSSMSFRV